MQRGGGAQMMQHNRAAQLLFHSSGHTSSCGPDHPAQYRHLSALHVAAGGGGVINMMPLAKVHAASKASSSSSSQQQQLQLALSCAPPPPGDHGEEGGGGGVSVEKTVADNPVVVFSVSSCCLCHVVKKLFCGMGVSPTVVEIDELEGARAAELDRVLVHIMGGERPAVPAVFVGGSLIGGLDRLMACHISGALIPQLKAAGALWL